MRVLENASKVSADAAGASLVSGGAVKDSNTAHFPISLPRSPSGSSTFIMPSEQFSTTTTEPTTSIPLSTVFCADNADIVIRATGNRDFRAHKLILSLVSPIFKDMFTLPQPSTDTSGPLPHVDVYESAETWENILRVIYPMPNPVIDDLGDLESLLLAAKKYEMQPIIDIHKQRLENQAFIQEDPLRLYAIACACGLDDQAKYVARNTEFLAVVRSSPDNDLKGLSVASYRRLIAFLVERDNELHPILERGWGSFNTCCNCLEEREVPLYEKTKKKLWTPYAQLEEVYFRALEDRSYYYKKACPDNINCGIMASKIRGFLEEMFAERKRVCDKFMWKE